jgi:hypothetical protein
VLHWNLFFGKAKKKKAEEKEKRAKLRAEKEKQRQLEKERQVKLAEEKRIKERPELLRKTMCHCVKWKFDEQKKLREQQAIGEKSGYVDKAAVYDAGRKVYFIELTIKHLEGTMSREGVKELGCEGRMPSSGWDLPCYDYQVKHRKAIEDLR